IVITLSGSQRAVGQPLPQRHLPSHNSPQRNGGPGGCADAQLLSELRRPGAPRGCAGGIGRTTQLEAPAEFLGASSCAVRPIPLPRRPAAVPAGDATVRTMIVITLSGSQRAVGQPLPQRHSPSHNSPQRNGGPRGCADAQLLSELLRPVAPRGCAGGIGRTTQLEAPAEF